MNNAKQAVWHGSDSYETIGYITIEETNKAVNETVNKLLANFPPPTALKVNDKK